MKEKGDNLEKEKRKRRKNIKKKLKREMKLNLVILLIVSFIALCVAVRLPSTAKRMPGSSFVFSLFPFFPLQKKKHKN